MDVSLVPFDPRTASREEWARFHAFRRLRHEERNPGDPVTEDATEEVWMRRGDPLWEETRFAASSRERPEEVIGWLTFSVVREGTATYANRAKEAQVNVQVLEPYRESGVGRRLLAKAADLAREKGKSLLIGWSQEEDGKVFLEAIGAEVAQRTRVSRLYLDEVDWKMLEHWAEEGPKRSPESTLEWTGDRIPDDVLVAYSEVLTEVINEAPRDALNVGDTVLTPEVVRQWESKMKESGGRSFGVMSREPDGVISGMTDIGYWPDEKTLVHQFITGVRRPYRGRGLGKWLKAANLLRVRKELPHVTVVQTGNATTNAAMLSINERMGFRPHKAGVAAQMPLEALEDYLRTGEGRG